MAVVAAVRHEDTRYDELLMDGIPRYEAQELVRRDIDKILTSWQIRR